MQSNQLIRKNFFILGAPKSGTTSLHFYLSQHQGIRFPVIKEPLFFEAEFEKGLKYYYDRYFPESKAGELLCDARPINLFLPFVPPRIAEVFPEAKLIVVLRDPVERAYSHWWMRWCKGREPLVFDQAINENLKTTALANALASPEGPELWRNALARDSGESSLRVYVEIGHYAEQIVRYLSVFPKRQLLIINSRHLQREPRDVLTRVLGFLDLEDFKKIPDLSAQNTGESRGRSKLLSSAHRTSLGKLAPKALRQALKRMLLPDVKRPAMTDASRDLLHSHYAPHEAALAKLLRDLDTIGF